MRSLASKMATRRANKRAYVAALFAVALAAPASAAPPTVVPSPGYDARLQEQHNALSTSRPADPAPKPLTPPVRRRHRGAH